MDKLPHHEDHLLPTGVDGSLNDDSEYAGNFTKHDISTDEKVPETSTLDNSDGADKSGDSNSVNLTKPYPKIVGEKGIPEAGKMVNASLATGMAIVTNSNPPKGGRMSAETEVKYLKKLRTGIGEVTGSFGRGGRSGCFR